MVRPIEGKGLITSDEQRVVPLWVGGATYE